MVRLAHGNYEKVHSFYRQEFCEDVNIWNRDIDKYCPDNIIENLSVHTGVSKSVIKNSTLSSYEGILFDHTKRLGRDFWISRLGIYHRVRTRYGLAICPLCLADSPDVYYRKLWRLTPYMVCSIHWNYLLDHCPNCGAPIAFYRRSIGVKSRFKPSKISLCFSCDFDLCRSKTQSANWEQPSGKKNYYNFFQMIENGESSDLFSISSFPLLVLSGIRILIKAITSNNKYSKTLLHALIPLFPGLNFILQDATKQFSDFSIIERHCCLEAALWLIEDWPLRFRQFCQQNKVMSSAFIREDINDVSFWLVKQLRYFCFP